MTKKQLLKILNDDSLELTVEELENIIEEELQKDESEMDPDLIEYCLYYISKAETDGGKEKKADSAGNDKIARLLLRRGAENAAGDDDAAVFHKICSYLLF